MIHLVLIILLITTLLKHPDSFAVFLACSMPFSSGVWIFQVVPTLSLWSVTQSVWTTFSNYTFVIHLRVNTVITVFLQSVISDLNFNFIAVAALTLVQVVWHDSKLKLCLNYTQGVDVCTFILHLLLLWQCRIHGLIPHQRNPIRYSKYSQFFRAVPESHQAEGRNMWKLNVSVVTD